MKLASTEWGRIPKTHTSVVDWSNGRGTYTEWAGSMGGAWQAPAVLG